MPEYIIKTDNDRNLVIEADRYSYNATEGTYEFFKKDDKADTQKVATVTNRAFLAIVEKNAEKADFYEHYDVNEDEKDDVCNDCLLEQFVTSDTFFDEVYNIIDFYHSPDNQEDTPPEAIQPVPVPETSVVVPDVPKEKYPIYPIEKWKTKEGHVWYGFHTKAGFVNFSFLSDAKNGRETQINTPDTFWSYIDLIGATKLEDNL